MSNDRGIRSYGPGKFDTLLDSWFYAVSLDGAESIGEAETDSSYTLIENPTLEEIDNAARDDGDSLTYEEKQEVLRLKKGGVILHENNQGFVSSEYYYSKVELDSAWQQAEDEVNDMYEDEDDYEDEDENDF